MTEPTLKGEVLSFCLEVGRNLTSLEETATSIKKLLGDRSRAGQQEWLRKYIRSDYLAQMKEKYNGKLPMPTSHLRNCWERLLTALYPKAKVALKKRKRIHGFNSDSGTGDGTTPDPKALHPASKRLAQQLSSPILKSLIPPDADSTRRVQLLKTVIQYHPRSHPCAPNRRMLP